MKVDYRANGSTLASLSASSFYFFVCFAQQIQTNARVWQVALISFFHWNQEENDPPLPTMQVAHMHEWFLGPYERTTQLLPTVLHPAIISRSFIQMHFPRLAHMTEARSHMCGRRLADGTCPISLTQCNETRLLFSDLQPCLMAKDREPTHSEGIFPLFKDNEITMYSMYH